MTEKTLTEADAKVLQNIEKRIGPDAMKNQQLCSSDLYRYIALSQGHSAAEMAAHNLPLAEAIITSKCIQSCMPTKNCPKSAPNQQ